MSKANKIIIILLVIGSLLTIAATIKAIDNDKTNNEYLEQQLRPMTADINYILPYKNKYMGNSSNLINLFRHLPLGETRTTFNLYPDELTARVYYKDTMLGAGKTNLKYTTYALEGFKHTIDDFYETEVKRSLVYNSTAAFVLIENLEVIIFEFTDTSFIVIRSDIEALYEGFSNILEEGVWQRKVQEPLEDEGYVKETAVKALKGQ